MLAYGVAGDLVDEYMRMSESTCIEAMYNFCRAIISVFGEVYEATGSGRGQASVLICASP
jgi:hypothetical protein